MNSNKVIVMEVKDDYVIAMTPNFEFVKIKMKKGIQEGQQIYIVDEDVYQGGVKNPFSVKNKLAKILTLLAILLGMLLAAFLLNPFKNNTYAIVSLDGDSSIEMELDEDKNIITATSRDNSISNKELDAFKGENFETVVEHVANSVNNDNYVLASYYVSDDKDSAYKNDIITDIEKNMAYLIIIEASEDDKNKSQSENGTLGHYKIKYIASLTNLEEYVNKNVNYDKLDKFVLSNENFIERNAKIREEITDKNKKSDYNHKEDDDDDDENEEDDDDDDDDDDDENEEDDDEDNDDRDDNED